MSDTLMPKILSSDEGQKYAVGSFRIRSLLLGDQTGGAFELHELSLGADAVSPEPHVHRKMDETFCVLEGEIAFTVDGKETVAKAGSVLFVPRNVPHGFTNRSGKTARMTLMFSPAGDRHKYFEGLENLFRGGKPAPGELLKLMLRYDQEPVDERQLMKNT